jgi:hypothetical protein
LQWGEHPKTRQSAKADLNQRLLGTIVLQEMFNASFLFASLLWGSVGLGYFIYGKKQGSGLPMIAGALMMGASYFIGSVLWMSLFCIALMITLYLVLRAGY